MKHKKSSSVSTNRQQDSKGDAPGLHVPKWMIDELMRLGRDFMGVVVVKIKADKVQEPHKLPVAPENWEVLKQNIPGLDDAAQGTYNPQRLSGIRVIETPAALTDTLRILEEQGLRLLTYREAFVILGADAKLKERLKEKSFWLKEIGARADGDYTLQPDGSLKEGRAKDKEKAVSVYQGDQPVHLYVYPDNQASWQHKRFNLSANVGPGHVTSMVVGLPQDTPINSICEAVRRKP